MAQKLFVKVKKSIKRQKYDEKAKKESILLHTNVEVTVC